MEKINDMAEYLFHQGTNYRAYEYLGAHKTDDGYVFRVWAPNADRIFLAGDFNNWGEDAPLERISEGGIWEITLGNDRISAGNKYKYKIYGCGQVHFKADPYATEAGLPPETASVVPTQSEYEWRDGGWLAYRKKNAGKFYSLPMNIYELHMGSWKRHEDGTPFSYTELARELAPYVKQMGYTHIEMMPITEYPFEGSWGYQVSSYFAPTSRYGTSDELKGFIDSMHEAGIGVILDWVPAHFPKDRFGLYEFDGKPLYEYQGADRMEHAGWGTRRFDVGRNEVQSFLVSSASYWLREFHIDAIRVDAVASMIYLDYDKLPGEWVPNIYGDNRCLEAIAFFRKLNSHVKGEFPDVLMIAEESTAWANITTFDNEGLGFDLKWNMGWMNDTLAYAELDPIYRKYHHNNLNFSLTYSFNEKYILSISHDEVVHGKRSFLDKMSGDYWQKFAGARAFMGYMMTHPGKKLNFMGGEIGQFREWDYEGEIEWFLLEYESHAKFQRYVAELNHFYLSQPALWQIEGSWDGFKWIDPDDNERSIISYRRIAKDGKELLVLINFTPVVYENFLLGTDVSGTYEEIFNSDDVRFGGSGVINTGDLKTTGIGISSCQDSVEIRVPPLGITVLRCKRKAPVRQTSPARKKA
jgi:1,4-alpha-glucan branching enzyme